jgi:hypothetical protein
MVILLLLATAFLVVAGCLRNTSVGFVFWFSVSASTIILVLLAANGIPKVQEGPGALTALGWIPVLIIWFCCGIIGVACWFTRPTWKWSSRSSVITIFFTVGTYSAIAFTVLNNPLLWGYYDLKIRILDWNQQPIQHVWVHSLRQKAVIDLGQALALLKSLAHAAAL